MGKNIVPKNTPSPRESAVNTTPTKPKLNNLEKKLNAKGFAPVMVGTVDMRSQDDSPNRALEKRIEKKRSTEDNKQRTPQNSQKTLVLDDLARDDERYGMSKLLIELINQSMKEKYLRRNIVRRINKVAVIRRNVKLVAMPSQVIDIIKYSVK